MRCPAATASKDKMGPFLTMQSCQDGFCTYSVSFYSRPKKFSIRGRFESGHDIKNNEL